MDQQPDKRRKNYILMRSVSDYGMGIVILGIGVFVTFSEKFGVRLGIDNLMRYLFAGLCVLYGGFRIYRGYAKQYFKKDD
jgi:hypothetical protein